MKNPTPPYVVGAHAGRREPRGADPVAPSVQHDTPPRLSPADRRRLLAVLEEISPKLHLEAAALGGLLGQELEALAGRVDLILALAANADSSKIARAS